VTLAACFAHVRRRFYELHVNESSNLATQTVTTMAGLWEIEAGIRSQDPATRAIVPALFDLWENAPPVRQIQARRGDPLCHVQAHRPRALPSNGRIDIDSNTSSGRSGGRPSRKNAVVRWQPRQWWDLVTIATLLQTAKMNDVDPHAWLAQTLERIAQGWSI
jgi:transposase